MAQKQKKHDKRAKHQPKKAAPKTTSRWWLYALAPALLGILLYAGTANHDYVLDDESAITQNWVVKKGTESIPLIFTTHYRYGYWTNAGTLYRPLALSLFAWQWEVAENDPGFAHVCNIVLYALSAFLLFLLLFRWFGRGDPWLPMLICLLFVAHPIHTEVVANIKSADELLAFVLSLASLLMLWQYLAKSNILWLVGSLVLFALAMFSKESVITLLAVIPMAIWLFTDTSRKKNAVLSALFIAPVAVYMMARFNALGALGTGDAAFAKIDNVIANVPAGVRYPSAIKLCGLYLWKLVLPHPLSHDYSFNEIPLSSFGDWRFWISLVVFVGMGIWGVMRLLKRDFIGFAILFFLATFSLYSNVIITIGTHFGERLLFLPSLGFAMATGYGLWWLGTRSGWRDAARFVPAKAILPLAILAVLLVAYGFKTTERAAQWENEIVLYKADRVNAPNSSRTHYRYGRSLMTQKLEHTIDPKARERLLKDAIASLQEAVAIYPQYADARGELGLAWDRLGVPDSAAKHYELALAISPTNYTVLNNYGSIYFNRGDFEQARDHFAKAIERHPRYIEAMGNLASVYGAMGNYPEAITWFKKALELAPNTASYHYFIGITYQNMQDAENAQKWLQQACQLDQKYCQ